MSLRTGIGHSGVVLWACPMGRNVALKYLRAYCAMGDGLIDCQKEFGIASVACAMGDRNRPALTTGGSFLGRA
jgi:hypothetical protein